MRKVLTLVFALGVLLAVTMPAQADCSNARLIRSIVPGSGFSYVETPGVIPEIATSSSVTPGAKGAFWVLGAGDPTPHPGGDEAGIDNGSFPAVVSSGAQKYYGGWLKFGFPADAYQATSASIGTTWAADGRIDGCSDNVDNACIAVLITDEHDGIGYFALVTKQADALLNFNLNQAGNSAIRLAQTPKLGINGSDTLSPSLVELLVSGPDLDALSGGLYLDGNCPSPITGYKVRGQTLAEGSDAPESRDRGDWSDISPTCCGDGCPGTSTCGPNSIPLGDSAVVQVPCTGDSDIYLATSLLFDSGFELDLVGENSTRVACGPTLADPQDLEPRKPIRKPGRKTKR